MKINIVSKPDCSECERIKAALSARGIAYTEENMDEASVPRQFELKTIARKHRQLSMPLIFVNGAFTKTIEFETQHLRGENA